MTTAVLKKSIIIVAVCAFISCEKEKISPNLVLIEATPLFSRDASELRTFIESSGLDLPVQELKFDVKVFQIDYKTDYKGQTVTASGLVILPDTQSPVAMISFQHGTIAAHDQAPSALPLNSLELILYSALASPGFIAVVPDFLGFGSSSDMLHPYYVEDITASTIVDMLRAAKELADDQGVTFNERLFLAGYSQGGYATMATHKALENSEVVGFDLIASYPAAGGYDVKGMQESFFALEQYDEPFYIAYVALAYKTYFGWDAPLSDFFNEPYAAAIPQLFNGQKSGAEINANLTIDVPALIQEDLLHNIDSDPRYGYIINAFIENSLLDWVPQKPMHLYHGTADVTVFYQNSVDTYETFLANGASEMIVTFTPLPGATHASGVAPYIEDIMPKIIALK